MPTYFEVVIGKIGLSDTVFGMTILAFLVSIEELAREVPAATKGRAQITFGNVAGSILAFFLFNAGIIALVRPVPVDTHKISKDGRKPFLDAPESLNPD